MKRYTLRIRSGSTDAEPAALRGVIERQLLNLPITFRIGAVAVGEDGEVLVEVASDSRIRDLRALLARPTLIQGLGSLTVEWGSQVAAARGGQAPGVDPDDPYRSASPQVQSTRVYGYQKPRGLWSAVAPLAVWPLVAAAIGLRLVVPIDERVYLFAWSALWVFVAGVGARNPFHVIRSVTCDQRGVEIRYWARPHRRHSWDAIEGLDVRPEEIVLWARGRRVRLVTRGLADRDLLVASIRDRAGLWFVEGGPMAQVSYRGSTAY
jgi:hypothetical protein